MQNYTYQNSLISKKHLRNILGWSFTNYNSMQACALADELKYLGFKYATQAGISISIEDLKIPFVKTVMLDKANKEIQNTEKIYLKGKITDVERFQKLIDTWSLTSESLKDQIIYFFKNYDPLNSVYIMAFSGARGNLSQVRQLVGMRGLMSDPSGQIMNLPIKKNFREGLTITDYLMSGYGARKGIVDTALKTANSGYLTRRLIDVAQDILIREQDCFTNHTFLISIPTKKVDSISNKILGRILSKTVKNENTGFIIAKKNTQITSNLIKEFKNNNIIKCYVRSPLTCTLYRAVCQKCYGWDLANENLVDIGEAIGILAGQSIGEPGTQLTMRTFHTGGIFTSNARQQISSPLSGIIQYHKNLKTINLRTNRGEDVLLTKSSGFLVLIPDNNINKLVQIEILRNTILFPKNNQYILKDTVIGELINTNKQIKREIKPILSDTDGEIFIPHFKQPTNLLNNNRLIWILSGQLYNSPKHSFLNFYPDYKLNRHSYIFRTKLVNSYNGVVSFSNIKKNLFQRSIKINNNKYSLINTKLQKLNQLINFNNFLIVNSNEKYLVNLFSNKTTNYLKLTPNNKFGSLLTNSFRTLTGGTIFYHYKNSQLTNKLNKTLYYFDRTNLEDNLKYNSFIRYRSLIWLNEEIHKVNCDPNVLLVEHGDFISQNFELIPTVFSNTCGLVLINKKNNLVKTISIKTGLVYECKKFKSIKKKIYYPGEIIFSNIEVKTISFCEQISGKKTDQLLIRPIDIYEFAYSTSNLVNFTNNNNNDLSIFKLSSNSFSSYKSNQSIKVVKNINLALQILTFKTNKSLNNNIKITLKNNLKIKKIDFNIFDNLNLVNYIPANLKYKNIQPCILIQANQFISNYTTFGYLEAITTNLLEIVKFKIKKQVSKQIFLISNKDCLKIKKSKVPSKRLNDFITSKTNLKQTGKIIIENDNYFTIQVGKPYFFPNCKNDILLSKANLQYKMIPSVRVKDNFVTNRKIYLNYYNLLRVMVNVNPKLGFEFSSNKQFSLKAEFSKLFIKNNGKFYNLVIPQFFKKFTIGTNNPSLKLNKLLPCKKKNNFKVRTLDRTLLVKISEIIKNNHKKNQNINRDYHITSLKFIEQPFKRTTRSVGLYSITEEYFEQDVNSLFCTNLEFIEAGKTIGLLNLEKEITGDIVQGLPRIEEILEARKKNIMIKRIPTSQKKGLLVQKTNLNPSFEFQKLGTSIFENDKINPHKLLKVYFNYYGLNKYFLCNNTKRFNYNRLLNNYEGSYKSFKKVQLFILKSVQLVYESQGVTINDKHLEVIIKQMTNKVLITYEGDTTLLRREVIDLYHIQYINEILIQENKHSAYYIPLLLGITKAALNNPSFISAASFQETTRVLTKAAIEGRIDWLRGLKENIIIGHLIPAGTGSTNYHNCFKQKLN